MILQLAMINQNVSYTNNKNGVYKSYDCNILFITMYMTIILNSYYKHIPWIRIIYTFNMTGIWLEYDLQFLIYLWYARFMSGICNMTIYMSNTLHMTGTWVVFDHLSVIYLSYDWYMTDKSMSYDNVCHMTGIYPLQPFCAFSVPVTLRFGPIIWLS